MPENYTITRVKPEPKPWNSTYGPMVTYTVLFEGRETPVEINKKPESPAPKVGDEVFGNISRTEYGDKFKSEQKPFSSRAGGYSPRPQADPFTMFLSYAKDIGVACICLDDKGNYTFNNELYSEVIEAVSAGGLQLYTGRPDGGEKVEVKVGKPDVVTEPAENVDLLKNIDEVFGEDEAPWEKPEKKTPAK